MPKVIATELQWVEKGMERFAYHGAEGLVIEKMAAELGCSKSSFYWYFRDRNAFVMRIVEHWAELSTAQVIRSSTKHKQVENQLEAMLKEMFSATGKGDFLFYLRKLAASCSSLEERLAEIEQLRISYAHELLVKTGLAQEVAMQKAELLYHYYLGWYERHKHHIITDKQLTDHIAMLRQQLLTV